MLCMAVKLNNLPGIDSIFRKNKKGNYYDMALLYQDILAFGLTMGKEEGGPEFTRWELARWLLDKNKELRNYYDDSLKHTTTSNRIENIQRRIKNRTTDLINWNLIKFVGERKQSKGTGTTPIYEITSSGLLLANLIATNRSINKEQSIMNVYKVIESDFSTINIRSHVFYMKFLKNCHDLGLLEKFVEHMWFIMDSGNATTIEQMLKISFDLGFKDESDRKRFLNLWSKSLEDMGEEDRIIILFEMKLAVERRFQDSMALLSREYEDILFRCRADYDKIVIEGRCEKCVKEYVLSLPYMVYKEKYANVNYGADLKLDCPECKNKESLHIKYF